MNTVRVALLAIDHNYVNSHDENDRLVLNDRALWSQVAVANELSTDVIT